jgi:hypothetical protein
MGDCHLCNLGCRMAKKQQCTVVGRLDWHHKRPGVSLSAQEDSPSAMPP